MCKIPQPKRLASAARALTMLPIVPHALLLQALLQAGELGLCVWGAGGGKERVTRLCSSVSVTLHKEVSSSALQLVQSQGRARHEQYPHSTAVCARSGGRGPALASMCAHSQGSWLKCITPHLLTRAEL